MLETLNGSWVAVQTRAGCERTAHEHVSHHGYDAFLPVHPVYGRRGVEVRPLFPGYFFCRYREAPRFRIIEASGVLGIVSSRHVPLVIAEEEIDALRRVVESGAKAEPWPFVRANTKVRIRCGPLEGLVGVYVAHRSGVRVVVNVELLMRSVAIELDAAHIVPLT